MRCLKDTREAGATLIKAISDFIVVPVRVSEVSKTLAVELLGATLDLQIQSPFAVRRAACGNGLLKLDTEMGAKILNRLDRGAVAPKA